MKSLVLAIALIPGAAFAELDPCLVGKWVPDMDLANAKYQSLMPVPVVLSGALSQTVTETGSTKVTFNDFVATVEQPGVGKVINRLNGEFDLNLTTSGDEMSVHVLASDTTVAMSMTAAGGPEVPMATQPLNVAELIDQYLTIGYTCDGDTITVQSRDETPTFAPVWYRIK